LASDNLYLCETSDGMLYMGKKSDASPWYSSKNVSLDGVNTGAIIISAKSGKGIIFTSVSAIGPGTFSVAGPVDMNHPFTVFNYRNGQLDFTSKVGALGALYTSGTMLGNSSGLQFVPNNETPLTTPSAIWISPEQMVNCCIFDQSGIPPDKNPCAPEYVTSGSGYCPVVMLEECKDWSTDKCQTYLQLIKNTPLAKDLVPQILKNYITNPKRAPMNDYCSPLLPFHHCPAGRDDSKDPFFTDIVPELCSATGSCDAILNQFCSQFLKEDLNKDPTLQTLCGCHLSESQMKPPQPPPDQGLKLTNTITRSNQYIYPGVPTVCDPICNIKNTILKNNTPCKGTTCIMDHVDINIINSATGPIDVGQFCGCKDGVSCNCFINDLNIDVANSKIQGGIQVFQKCGACFTFDSDNPAKVQQIDCNTLKPLSKSVYANYSSTSNKNYFVYIIIIFLIIIFLYFFLRK
jgi:hypothetical protein